MLWYSMIQRDINDIIRSGMIQYNTNICTYVRVHIHIHVSIDLKVLVLAFI